MEQTPRGAVQMGGNQPLPDPNAPPPAWQGPESAEFGLGQFKEHMSEGAWSVFINCVGWCVHWQDLHDGKRPSIDERKLGLFAAPFVGVGDPNMWPIYQQMVSTLFMSVTQDWFENGEEYRRDHSLVWPVVIKLGPDLAQVSRGWNARMAIKDLIKNNRVEVTFR